MMMMMMMMMMRWDDEVDLRHMRLQMGCFWF